MGKAVPTRSSRFPTTTRPIPRIYGPGCTAYEDKTGGRLLAIPHNGNLSNGMMFDNETMGDGKLNRDYAERRMRWEPIYEVT